MGKSTDVIFNFFNGISFPERKSNLCIMGKGKDVMFKFIKNGSLYSAKRNGLNFVFINKLGKLLNEL